MMQINPARVWRYNEKRRKYLGKVGKLVGYSIVHAGPTGLAHKTPYVVGLIEVDGERVVAQVVGVSASRLFVGMRLVGRLRRLFEVDAEAVVLYGVKFGLERQT